MPNQDTRTEAADAARLSELLITHAKGSTDAEAGAALAQVVAAVAETEKNGAVTIKLSVKPVKKTDGAIAITAEVVAKVPQHDAPASIWYADDGGQLSRQHPNQMQFPDFPPVRD